MPTLIIVIGNPPRGDDGLGWDVASELSSELRRDERASISHASQLHRLIDIDPKE